jgi:hypothetical protein
MSADRSVTATFENHLPVILLRTHQEYSTITAAYNDAVTSDSLKASAVTFVEDPTFNKTAQITLTGGFNCTFTSNDNGFSTIYGSVTIGGPGTGGIIIENFIIY